MLTCAKNGMDMSDSNQIVKCIFPSVCVFVCFYALISQQSKTDCSMCQLCRYNDISHEKS